MTDVLAMEVDESAEELVHDHGGLALSQMFPMQDEVEELSPFAVPLHTHKSNQG